MGKFHLFVQNPYTLSLGLFLFLSPTAFGQDFITEWTFDQPGTEITFHTETNGPVGYTWSTSPSGNSGNGTFLQDEPDEVILTGLEIEAGDVVTLSMAPQNLKRFFMAFDSDSEHLTNVVQWGAVAWINMHNTFWGCENLTISASDSPNLAFVTDMTGMFNSASSFNQSINDWDVSNVSVMDFMFRDAESFNQDLNGWDVSAVTSMERIFAGATAFNGDITNWDVGNVTVINGCFWGAESFNRDIGGWDVSNVVDITSIFHDALVFNQDIGSWDVSSVTVMRYVFSNAVSFNQDIGDWDVSAVVNMQYMFKDANSFNQDIGQWDVSSVVIMDEMFANSLGFNQDIGGWDVSAVQNMNDMFENATVFNQYIGDWDVSAVTDMNSMFAETEAFNQDIGNWDVSSVVDMDGLFEEAIAFNQDIGNWDVSNVEEMWDLFSEATAFNQNLGNWILHPEVILTRAFEFSGMDCDNYSATLIGWRDNNPEVTGRTLGAEGMEYGTIAAEARDSLIIAQEWDIEFDSPSSEACDGVLSVDLFEDQIKGEITVYPNPTRDKISISGASSELEHIRIISTQGRDVTPKTSIQSNSTDEKVIDISRLDAGVYVLKTTTNAARVVKQ